MSETIPQIYYTLLTQEKETVIRYHESVTTFIQPNKQTNIYI